MRIVLKIASIVEKRPSDPAPLQYSEPLYQSTWLLL